MSAPPGNGHGSTPPQRKQAAAVPAVSAPTHIDAASARVERAGRRGARAHDTEAAAASVAFARLQYQQRERLLRAEHFLRQQRVHDQSVQSRTHAGASTGPFVAGSSRGSPPRLGASSRSPTPMHAPRMRAITPTPVAASAVQQIANPLSQLSHHAAQNSRIPIVSIDQSDGAGRHASSRAESSPTTPTSQSRQLEELQMRETAQPNSQHGERPLALTSASTLPTSGTRTADTHVAMNYMYLQNALQRQQVMFQQQLQMQQVHAQSLRQLERHQQPERQPTSRDDDVTSPQVVKHSQTTTPQQNDFQPGQFPCIKPPQVVTELPPAATFAQQDSRNVPRAATAARQMRLWMERQRAYVDAWNAQKKRHAQLLQEKTIEQRQLIQAEKAAARKPIRFIDGPGKGRYRLTEEDAIKAADCGLTVVPIRFDITVDGQRLIDCVMWNMHDPILYDTFAQILCHDYGLPVTRFAPAIVAEMERQVSEFSAVTSSFSTASLFRSVNGQGLIECEQDGSKPLKREEMVEIKNEDSPTPLILHARLRDDDRDGDEVRVVIKLDLLVGPFHYVDAIEWDMNCKRNSPEQVADVLVDDLCRIDADVADYASEFCSSISFAIHEQLYLHAKALFIAENDIGDINLVNDELKEIILPAVNSASKPPCRDDDPATFPRLRRVADEEERAVLETNQDIVDRRPKRRRTARSKQSAMPDLTASRVVVCVLRRETTGSPSARNKTDIMATEVNESPRRTRRSAAPTNLREETMFAVFDEAGSDDDYNGDLADLARLSRRRMQTHQRRVLARRATRAKAPVYREADDDATDTSTPPASEATSDSASVNVVASGSGSGSSASDPVVRTRKRTTQARWRIYSDDEDRDDTPSDGAQHASQPGEDVLQISALPSPAPAAAAASCGLPPRPCHRVLDAGAVEEVGGVWVERETRRLREHHPDARFVVVCPASADGIGGPPALASLRIECLHCPDALFPLGPGESLGIFGQHLSSAGHLRRVRDSNKL